MTTPPIAQWGVIKKAAAFRGWEIIHTFSTPHGAHAFCRRFREYDVAKLYR